MKTIKFLLALFLIPYSLFLCHAQTDAGKKHICTEYIKEFRYKYIFEGKIISSKYITLKTGEYTYYNYNSYLVEVRKVVKGNIQKGTIAILQAAPGIVYKDDKITKSMGQCADCPGPPPSEAIYFSNAGVDVKDSGVANTNSTSLLYYDGIPLSNGELVKEKGGGIKDYFSTLAEFYDYISANYGVKIDSAK